MRLFAKKGTNTTVKVALIPFIYANLLDFTTLQSSQLSESY